MKRKLYPNQPHSETANSLNNLGLVYKKLGELEKARKYLHEAVEVSRKAVGENHAETKKFKMNLEGCQPSICTTQ
jgi:Tfp pilus assembly protein PilF